VTREQRDRWVEALASARYMQGRTFLGSGSGTYCCLGVLAELEGVPREPDPFARASRFEFSVGGATVASTTAPPGGWLGLTAGQIDDLISLNDSGCWSFPQIAAWVAREIPADDGDGQ
jgi:hypothetical protein